MTQPYPQYPAPTYPPVPTSPYGGPGSFPPAYSPQVPQYPGYPQIAPAGYGAPAAPAPGTGQAITPPVPTLRDGGSSGGSVSPKMRHLVGRTIIVEPVAIGTADVKGKTLDEARFHLTVIDGGPIRYGDNIDDRDRSKNRPNTHEIDTPCRFTNVTDISYGFVQAVRDALDAGEHGRVGVVQQGTKGNMPFLITKCGTDVHGNERPDGDARFAAAMEIFGKIWADKHAPAGHDRQFVSPEPRSLVAAPAAGAPAVNYGTPPAPPAYGGIPAPSYPPYPGAAAPQSAPPAAVPLPEPVEAWLATLPPDQAAGARAQYLAQQQPAAAGPGI